MNAVGHEIERKEEKVRDWDNDLHTLVILSVGLGDMLLCLAFSGTQRQRLKGATT